MQSRANDEWVWREVQPVWPLLIVLPLVVAAILALSLLGLGDSPIPTGAILLLCGVPALVLLVLGRLVTEVRHDALYWRFGWLGRPQWRLPLADIAAIEPARSRWSEGLGLRRTREGMLYNAQGRQAVRLTLRSGRRLRLGTQEPQRLIQALEPRLRKTRH